MGQTGDCSTWSTRPQPRFAVDPASLSQQVIAQQQAGRGLLALIQPLAAQLSQTPLLKSVPVVVGILAATLLAIRLPVIAGQSAPTPLACCFASACPLTSAHTCGSLVSWL